MPSILHRRFRSFEREYSVTVAVRMVVLQLPEMVLLVELVPVSEQVLMWMPDPSVDHPDPLMWSVPNPQLD